MKPDEREELRKARQELARLKAGSGGEIEQDLVTMTRVAQLFGVSRKSLYEWRAEGREGLPEKIGDKEDLNAWRAWFAANPSAGHSKGKPRKDRETLLCEKLEIEIQILETKLKKASRELMPVAEARESATRIYSAVKAELLKMTSELPPSLSGLGEVEIQKKLRAAVITILTDLSSETNTAFEAKDEEDEDAG